jgi:hypothetical protein
MRPQAHAQGQENNRVTRPLPRFIAKTRFTGVTQAIIKMPVWTVNGEILCSAEGVALLVGVSADEIRAQAMPNEYEAAKWLPPQWLKAARRRAREAMAYTGADDFAVGLGLLGAQGARRGDRIRLSGCGPVIGFWSNPPRWLR